MATYIHPTADVAEGAVIFRTGDKLYIVDGKEVTK